MAGFNMLQTRCVRDDLGRNHRRIAWTRAAAERLEELTAGSLLRLEPDLRALRWEFWNVIELGVLGTESLEEAFAVEAGEDALDRGFWRAVETYLYALIDMRCELEMLRLAPGSSLTGEARTGR